MLRTTVEVVCRPTLRASRRTEKPLWQAIMAMARANAGVFYSPKSTVERGNTSRRRL